MLEITPQVHEKIRELCRHYGVKEFSLFGSSLTARFNERSDIDLLLEFSPNFKASYVDFFELKHELEDLLHMPVDLVPKRAIRPQLKDTILSSANILYAS